MSETITPGQARAARGFIDWSQSDLARAANISLSTVRDFERERRTPMLNNLIAMQTAFERAGLRFTFGENVGVRRVGIRDLKKTGQEPSPDVFPPDHFDQSEDAGGPEPEWPAYGDEE